MSTICGASPTTIMKLWCITFETHNFFLHNKDAENTSTKTALNLWMKITHSHISEEKIVLICLRRGWFINPKNATAVYLFFIFLEQLVRPEPWVLQIWVDASYPLSTQQWHALFFNKILKRLSGNIGYIKYNKNKNATKKERAT